MGDNPWPTCVALSPLDYNDASHPLILSSAAALWIPRTARVIAERALVSALIGDGTVKSARALPTRGNILSPDLS